ncbi:short-chain dehydrogenase of various substrate specificities [Longilinea arvoryzae]|uniref:Short-chain dehydrogenase of various substrate specificities n=1 Tax=Longilinea arvoryzae TaxID=360412 RepID=A0A0S7BFT7_9CHLR|nr:SDR family NAD(P)-dependent oxidoreductase [Longilinea arvoryzae]GAP12968.1 short-chain dehydrogenase of various substrate specificities [Longilinea arvoryzae]
MIRQLPAALRGQLALITGASSGIGAAAARRLAGLGMRVALVARRTDRLNALAAQIEADGGQAQVITADLTQPAERDALASLAPETTVLVNNAGLGWYGYFVEMPPSLVSEMLQVNLMAVAELIRAFLPAMKKRGSGHIINISSVAGGMPEQGIVLYSATKAFMDAFTTALHRELGGTQVHAGLVCPGPVSSEFYPRAAGQPNGRPVPAERLAVPPEQVAEAIVRLLVRPRRRIYVPGWLLLSRWVEPLFGGLIDQLGPLLLKRD